MCKFYIYESGTQHETLSIKLLLPAANLGNSCHYSDVPVKRFCLTVCPSHSLSFASLINIDRQPDRSKGRNLRQDQLLSPCYHCNGFRWGPPDTGGKEKWIYEACLTYSHFAFLTFPSTTPPTEPCLRCWSCTATQHPFHSASLKP